MYGAKANWSQKEIKLFRKLDTPGKVQDYLNPLKINFEQKGDTCYSPRFVIQHKKAHCMEGAMFAAAVLEFHGHKPLVLDLRSQTHDFDHVVAVFKQFGCWGAISKTNHAVLRYREPVYTSIRELAMSYFHEYFDDKGRKTLREYSRPFDLKYFDGNLSASRIHSRHLPSPGEKNKEETINWRTTSAQLFQIPDYLDEIKHFDILNKKQIKNLRKADAIEIKSGELVEFRRK